MRNPLFVTQSVENWNRQFQKGTWQRVLHERANNTHKIAEICSERAKARPRQKTLRILDAGCGSGALLEELRARSLSYEYVGFDFSDAAIRKINIVNSTHERVCVADLYYPPSSTEKFDAIVFNEVLYYVSPIRCVRAYRELLAPDGVVVVSIYASWRRPFIFALLSCVLAFDRSYYVSDMNSHRSWIIKTATFRWYFQ